MVCCTKSSEGLKLSPVRLASISPLNLFCENLRIKVLSVHFLKLPTSGKNEPKKGDSPLLQWIIQSSASGGPGTVGIWYFCCIP